MKRLFVWLSSLALLLGALFGASLATGVASGAPGSDQPVSTVGRTVLLQPCRIADSRTWQTLTTFSAFQEEQLMVAGKCGIPDSHVAGVFLSLTVVPQDNYYPGYLTVWPTPGSVRPEVSQVSFTWMTTSAQALVGPLTADGEVNIFNGSSTYADVIVDVSGYVTS
jgi:hypothetical protein